MGTNNVTIKLCESIEAAPVYHDKGYKVLSFEEAVIVKNGTVEGNPTVDIVLTSPEGEKFVAMVTGKIFKAVASAVGETN